MASDNNPVQAASGSPRIEPVPEGTKRPFWSVMIPTYHCAQYLREALGSVLNQDPGEERMQIEVIDDCSTKDDPEAVVKEQRSGRVQFYRQPRNGGVVANFNTCITRARGEWVHILHGDDYVAPGFYAAAEEAIRKPPKVGFVSSRVMKVDNNGILKGMTSRVLAMEKGGAGAESMYYTNLFFFPGVVVSREAYEAVGGFHRGLAHVADWEMWVRVIRHAGGRTISRPLASYRVFEGNDTSKLMRTGENLRDHMRLREMFASTYEQFDRVRFSRIWHKASKKQEARMRRAGDEVAANAAREVAEAFGAELGQRGPWRAWRVGAGMGRHGKGRT